MFIYSEVKAGLEARGFKAIGEYSTGNSPYSPEYSTFIKAEFAETHPCEGEAYDLKVVGKFPTSNPNDCYKGRTAWNTVRVINPNPNGAYVMGDTSDADAASADDLPPIRVRKTIWLVDKKTIARRKDGLTQLLGDLF